MIWWNVLCVFCTEERGERRNLRHMVKDSTNGYSVFCWRDIKGIKMELWAYAIGSLSVTQILSLWETFPYKIFPITKKNKLFPQILCPYIILSPFTNIFPLSLCPYIIYPFTLHLCIEYSCQFCPCRPVWPSLTWVGAIKSTHVKFHRTIKPSSRAWLKNSGGSLMKEMWKLKRMNRNASA